VTSLGEVLVLGFRISSTPLSPPVDEGVGVVDHRHEVSGWVTRVLESMLTYSETRRPAHVSNAEMGLRVG